MRLLLLLLLVGCKRDKEAQHRAHPARQLATWGGLPKEVRAQKAPPWLLDYVREDNQLYGFSGSPKAVDLTAEEAALVEAALREVSPELQPALAMVAGLAFVDELGSTGFTEHMEGPERASFMVFERKVLHTSLDDFATLKEQTVFADAEALRVHMSDKPAPAFPFMLSHELAHVIAFARRLHPIAQAQELDETPFSRLSWARGKDNKFTLRPELRFPYRLGFYGAAPKIPLKAEIYGHARSDCFASLYAMTSVDDDFAETVALYLHARAGNPYQVRAPGVSFDTPVLDPHCKAKLNLVLKNLGPSSPPPSPASQ